MTLLKTIVHWLTFGIIKAGNKDKEQDEFCEDFEVKYKKDRQYEFQHRYIQLDLKNAKDECKRLHQRNESLSSDLKSQNALVSHLTRENSTLKGEKIQYKKILEDLRTENVQLTQHVHNNEKLIQKFESRYLGTASDIAYTEKDIIQDYEALFLRIISDYCERYMEETGDSFFNSLDELIKLTLVVERFAQQRWIFVQGSWIYEFEELDSDERASSRFVQSHITEFARIVFSRAEAQEFLSSQKEYFKGYLKNNLFIKPEGVIHDFFEDVLEFCWKKELHTEAEYNCRFFLVHDSIFPIRLREEWKPFFPGEITKNDSLTPEIANDSSLFVKSSDILAEDLVTLKEMHRIENDGIQRVYSLFPGLIREQISYKTNHSDAEYNFKLIGGKLLTL
jgi:hypothetical protein